MSLRWFFRFSERTHVLLIPFIIVIIGSSIATPLLIFSDSSFVQEALPTRQLLGTFSMFTLLSAYLLAVMPLQRLNTSLVLSNLEGLSTPNSIQHVKEHLDQIPRFGYTAIFIGILFGLMQNPLFVLQIFETREIHLLDIVFMFEACLIWVLIALLLVWRIPLSLSLSRLGASLNLDLFRLNLMNPLSKLATNDVLFVAGAMAFTPLQSLDAEWRLGNYLSATIVGILAATFLYMLPLWGLYKNIKSTKAIRVHELEDILIGVNKDDLERLELVASHLDRIRAIQSWPVNLGLVSRIIVYIIIPPLAWVAAALVENMIEGL